jgi:hypothetical protein
LQIANCKSLKLIHRVRPAGNCRSHRRRVGGWPKSTQQFFEALRLSAFCEILLACGLGAPSWQRLGCLAAGFAALKQAQVRQADTILPAVSTASTQPSGAWILGRNCPESVNFRRIYFGPYKLHGTSHLRCRYTMRRNIAEQWIESRQPAVSQFAFNIA